MSAFTYATAQLLRVVPRAQVGHALGRLADAPWPSGIGRAVVGLYSRVYDVEFCDCAKRGGWPSFDAFFTRELREGARPVDRDGHAIVSPADGRIASLGRVDETSRLLVKGRPYSVGELVGSEAEGRRYAGGLACVIYLSPRDYHRVHSPIGGQLQMIRSLPGDYYPVNNVGLRHVPNLFVRNRRVALVIEAPPETGLGRVTIVMVSAMIVGRVTVTGISARDVPLGEHMLDAPVEKGDQIGVFHLGSTAIMLLEKSASACWTVTCGAVRFGERIAERVVTRDALPANGRVAAMFSARASPEGQE
jgi:phosphatidylserine decarboxylase